MQVIILVTSANFPGKLASSPRNQCQLIIGGFSFAPLAAYPSEYCTFARILAFDSGNIWPTDDTFGLVELVAFLRDEYEKAADHPRPLFAPIVQACSTCISLVFSPPLEVVQLACKRDHKRPALEHLAIGGILPTRT